MSERPGQSFGEQAARFSLYAPFVGFLIGFLSRSSQTPSASTAMFTINCCLIVVGLLLGIAALISMRRYGTEGILVRAIVGVFLNGMVIVALLIILLPVVQAGRMKQRLTGSWTAHPTDAPNESVVLTLRADNSFQLERTRDSEKMVSLDGTWAFTRTHLLGVEISHVTEGEASVAGKKIGLGTVTSVDDSTMVLKTDDGEERYTRTR